MKNEKLKSLVNKLVELKTETDHFKGFLYLEKGTYYSIKPIEVYHGSAKEGKLFLVEESQVDSIKVAESPKLMKISMKSWHYRLMKWILKKNTPTPKTMQNGCPYFWLLVACLIIAPFYAFITGAVYAIALVPWLFFKFMDFVADQLTKLIPEEKVLSINDPEDQYYPWITDYDKMPMLVKNKYKRSYSLSFVDEYVKLKYGVTKKDDPDKFKQILADLREKRKEAERQRELKQKEQDQAIHEYLLKLKQKRLKREAREARMEKFWKPFNDRMSRAKNATVSAMKFNYSNAQLIKRTKQFVGFIISALTLVASIFVVLVLNSFIIDLVDGIVFVFSNYWAFLLTVLGYAIATGIIILIGYFTANWLQIVIDKYKSGRKLWYVEFLFYFTYYPVKYVVLGIFYLLLYSIWVPLEFVFYTVLFKLVLVPIWKFIRGLYVALSGVIIGSLGIFGEYFGASKKDYCPGIEWVDTDES